MSREGVAFLGLSGGWQSYAMQFTSLVVIGGVMLLCAGAFCR
jgi:hypothetical protein